MGFTQSPAEQAAIARSLVKVSEQKNDLSLHQRKAASAGWIRIIPIVFGRSSWVFGESINRLLKNSIAGALKERKESRANRWRKDIIASGRTANHCCAKSRKK